MVLAALTATTDTSTGTGRHGSEETSIAKNAAKGDNVNIVRFSWLGRDRSVSLRRLKMRFFPRLIFAAVACIAAIGAVAYWLARGNQVERLRPGTQASQFTSHAALSAPYPGPGLTTFPDPTAPAGSSARVFIDPQIFDGLVAAVIAQFTDKVRDEGSLDEYREAIAHRARAGQGAAPAADSLVSISTPRPRWIRRLQALWIYRQLAFCRPLRG